MYLHWCFSFLFFFPSIVNSCTQFAVGHLRLGLPSVYREIVYAVHCTFSLQKRKIGGYMRWAEEHLLQFPARCTESAITWRAYSLPGKLRRDRPSTHGATSAATEAPSNHVLYRIGTTLLSVCCCCCYSGSISTSGTRSARLFLFLYFSSELVHIVLWSLSVPLAPRVSQREDCVIFSSQARKK